MKPRLDLTLLTPVGLRTFEKLTSEGVNSGKAFRIARWL